MIVGERKMDTCNQLFRGLADGYDYDAISFLGAFKKLRKSFVLSARPSVSMEQLGSH
jgi:hypothetical protein